MFPVVDKRVLTPVTKMYVVEAPLVAARAQPGQFVIVRVSPEGERIPLTIADYDRARGTVTIIVQEVGKTTRLMDELQAGDSILNFVGPLGRPAEIRTEGVVCCVGGGFGVAPVYPIARELFNNGVTVLSIIGARTKELVILEDEMKAVSSELFVATDDGSYGEQGFVTTVLERLIGERTIDEAIAIGPMPMMRAVAETTRPHKLKTLVSLDPIMVDGTGMCGACRVEVDGKTKFACVDGPIFEAHAIDFDLAQKRTKMYVDDEKLADQLYTCAATGGACSCR